MIGPSATSVQHNEGRQSDRQEASEMKKNHRRGIQNKKKIQHLRGDRGAPKSNKEQLKRSTNRVSRDHKSTDENERETLSYFCYHILAKEVGVGAGAVVFFSQAAGGR